MPRSKKNQTTSSRTLSTRYSLRQSSRPTKGPLTITIKFTCPPYLDAPAHNFLSFLLMSTKTSTLRIMLYLESLLRNGSLESVILTSPSTPFGEPRHTEWVKLLQPTPCPNSTSPSPSAAPPR